MSVNNGDLKVQNSVAVAMRRHLSDLQLQGLCVSKAQCRALKSISVSSKATLPTGVRDGAQPPVMGDFDCELRAATRSLL